MACQPNKCKKCGHTFPSCQLRDGICTACRKLVQLPVK